MTLPRVALTRGPSIAAIVLPRRQQPRTRVTHFGLAVGLAVHVGVGWASATLPSPCPSPAVADAAPLRVSTVHTIPLAPPALASPPPAPPPPAAPRVAPTTPPPRRALATAPPPPAPAEPAPEAPALATEPVPEAPAQAAEVVQAPASAPTLAPADFAMVTGAAAVYAGGVTASAGTSATAVHTATREGVPGGVGVGSGTPSSLARPVGQPTRAWRCDWPDAASGLDVDVEFVNLRVAVEADGQLSDVRVIRHAGYGFDVEARRCALRHTLPPARDASGALVRTPSHPIRLRFER